MYLRGRNIALPATLLALAVLAGCSSSANRAPVEDRRRAD